MGHQHTASSMDATTQQHDQASTSNSNGGPTSSAFSQLSFAEVLEDLSSRFIVNLPAEELASIERICFQVEQAHWFYEDFLRPLNPSLTSFSLRRFSSYLLHTSALTVPLIQRYISTSSSGKQNQQDLEAAFDEFMKYKTRVPVCGVVMLNKRLDKCILVKGWKSNAAWGFPKGKINQQESERDCAVREVLEETGFDCSPLLPSDSKDFMELTMREQKIRLYIVPGVDEDTHFETLTRKEISRIDWFKLSDLPTWKIKRAPPQGMGGKFYLVSPFIGNLRAWISKNKPHKVAPVDAAPTEPTAMQILSRKEDDVDLRSDDLKALLGLQQTIPPATEKGRRMIEEQGDARSRQLLDLLRGDSSASPFEGERDQTVLMDERERGTATLLAALNAGAGKITQMPVNEEKSESATLLSMLNGSASSHLQTAVTPQIQLPRNSSPLPAPHAQKTSQAQSLLKLISPGNAMTSSPLSTDINEKEQQRARQRDALLSSLMTPSSISHSSPPSDQDQRVSDFRFPSAGPLPTQKPNNLLSLLQPNMASNVQQRPAPAPSPFSTFVQQAIQAESPAKAQDQNPLLALLNNNGGNNNGQNGHLVPQFLHPSTLPYPMHQQHPPPPSFPPQFMAYPPPPPPFQYGYLAQAIPAHHQHHPMVASPPHHFDYALPPPPPAGPPHYINPGHPTQASEILARLLPS